MAKVLVVDDSALMRKHLTKILDNAGFEVETARNGEECLSKIPEFEPDAITMDINMPVMDGLTCLSLIMNTQPLPVVMVSSLTEKGALSTFEALELGALDYVPKPGGTVSLNMSESAEMLIAKVSSAVKSKVRSGAGLKNKLRIKREQAEKIIETARPKRRLKRTRHAAQTTELIVMGVSTGGPGCIQEILQKLPETFPIPIVIAQHMPEKFTEVFAQRLDKICALKVQEVKSQTKLEAGNVYIAKGDADAKIIKRRDQLFVSPISMDPQYLWHPSVSKLVDSALDVVDAEKLLCVQLTGMGNDGADAMSKAHQGGAFTIAESQETAVVYGMPKELVRRGCASLQLPNYEIADAILDAVS